MKSQLKPQASLVEVLLRLLLLHSILFSEVPGDLCPGVADSNQSANEDLRGARVGETVSTSPHCEKLLRAEPLALHSGGDVVIGGLFPLHYVVPQLLHSYQNKPQPTPCSG